MRTLRHGMPAFTRDLERLRAELGLLRGPRDVRHLRAIEAGCGLLWLAGLATSAWGVNPLSPLLFASAASTRWMVLAHHVCHGALDGLPDVPLRLTSKGFARGCWRWLQWPDWIEPQAWRREHNQLHHAYTNEAADPDLVETQLTWLRASRMPRLAKYVVIAAFSLTWRWLYYAPSTSLALADPARGRPEARPLGDRLHEVLPPWTPAGKHLWLHSILPHAAFQFGVAPALLLPLGTHAWLAALVHALMADLLTNVHTFLVIVPNHAGQDLWRFDDRAQGKGQWALRQILSSCNYTTGGGKDLAQGWLNHQIEHHVWPDLTPLQLRAAAPRLRQLCRHHGIPYVQEPLARRVLRMVAIMTGAASHPRAATTDPLARSA